MSVVSLTEHLTKQNYRDPVFTFEGGQVTTQFLQPGETIPRETHTESDQVFFILFGSAEGTTWDDLGAKTVHDLRQNRAFHVPKGTPHEIKNAGIDPVFIATAYFGKPEHGEEVVNRQQ